MPYPTIAAGMRLTAGMLAGMQMQTVEQTTAFVINNSATLADTSIVVPVLAGAVYRYWLVVGYSTDDTDSSADLRLAWAADTGIEVRRWSWGLGSSGTGTGDDFTSVNFRRPVTDTDVRIGTMTDGTTNSYYEQGLFVGGSADGDATFQAAQWTAEAVDTTLTGSSRVEYIRIA